MSTHVKIHVSRKKEAAARRAPGRNGAGSTAPRETAARLSLSARTYERIKEDIITCALPPGAEISEAFLAKRYRMGKAPIRWALASLSRENLVTARPRRGYVVAPVTLQAVRDLFDLRLILEPQAARLAVSNIDARRLKELNAACEAEYAPGDRTSEARFLRANKAFHVSIARASGNQRLAEALEGILEEMERLFHLGLALRNRSEEMRHEHSKLVDALLAGDRKKAEEATVEQIEAARQMVLGALIDSAQLRSANISVLAG